MDTPSKLKFVSKDEMHFRWKTWGSPSTNNNDDDGSSGSSTGEEGGTPACSSNANANGDGNHSNTDIVIPLPRQQPQNVLQVSNDQCPVIEGLTVFQDLLSGGEADQLVQEIQLREFTYEGFEQRRRVQRYNDIPRRQNNNKSGVHLDDENMSNDTSEEDKDDQSLPETLQLLMDRMALRTGHWPQHISVEEYSTQQTLKVTQYGCNGYNAIVTSFETTSASSSSCPCQLVVDTSRECRCFVAQIPLQGSAVKHVNKPKRRHPTCFDLESSQHWNDIRLDPQALLVQTGDCLWNWRSRVSALPPSRCLHQKESSSSQDNNGSNACTFFILKLYNLPPESTESTAANAQAAGQEVDGKNLIDYDDFGYMGAPETAYRSMPMPPLEDVLTIIVTTSPIKSNPSTEVIEKTFETFLKAGHDFAVKCRKLIVCDGCRRLDDESEKVSRRHNNVKQAMRNGIVSATQAENYNEFKAALRELCANASDSSPLYNTDVEELDTRLGYGFALRHALRNCVTTPYVCVIQHDRTFMRKTPMLETMRAMYQHRYIKYITISMRSNLMYRDLFMGKYGKTYYQDFDDMILRLPELNLDREVYGPPNQSVEQMTCEDLKVRASIHRQVEKYKGSEQNRVQQDWIKNNPPTEPEKHQLTLTPVLFWYDNVHIAETEHYRDFVFDHKFKMVKKGGFVEDKLSPVLTGTLERLGLREGHSRFGCFMLDDHSGLFFTGHIDGGAYVSKAKRKELYERHSKEE